MCGAGTPSALVATAVSATRIDLSWADNRLGNGFKIERSTDGINFAQIAQVLTNTTTYRNTGLAPGSTYYYRVCAYTSGGNSDYSNVANASTPALCVISVAGWGDNNYGEATPPTNLANVVAIAGGNSHSLALIGNGTVVGWGSNSNGQTNSPAGLTNAVAVAAGGLHSLALKSDGTVVGWGSNSNGQTNSPAGLTNAVAVAAGLYHSLALKSDGTVIGWGYNNFGQNANVPPGSIGVVAIATGYYHSLALKSDGTVVGWGFNNAGQTNVPSSVTNAVAIAAGLLFQSGVEEQRHHRRLGRLCTAASGADQSGGHRRRRLRYGAGERRHRRRLGRRSHSPDRADQRGGHAAGDYHSLAMTCGPNAPSALVATAVFTNQINLSWTDNSGDENRFGSNERLRQQVRGPRLAVWTPLSRRIRIREWVAVSRITTASAPTMRSPVRPTRTLLPPIPQPLTPMVTAYRTAGCCSTLVIPRANPTTTHWRRTIPTAPVTPFCKTIWPAPTRPIPPPLSASRRSCPAASTCW